MPCKIIIIVHVVDGTGKIVVRKMTDIMILVTMDKLLGLLPPLALTLLSLTLGLVGVTVDIGTPVWTRTVWNRISHTHLLTIPISSRLKHLIRRTHDLFRQFYVRIRFSLRYCDFSVLEFREIFDK